MERFVQFIVGGGLATVAGLWILASFDPGTTAWLLGLLLAAAGSGGLLYGIADPLDP